MPEITPETYRAVWAALESGRNLTLDQIQIVTGLDPEEHEIIGYLHFLMQHKYIWMRGVRRAVSGEALPLFKMVNRTGPEAPYPDEDGDPVDPNVGAPLAAPLLSGRARYAPAPPGTCMATRVRLAAERLPQPFTREDLRAAVAPVTPDERRQFRYTWKALRHRGNLSGGPVFWRYSHPRSVDAVRDYLKRHVGRGVTAQELAEHCSGDSGTVPGSVINAAVRLLEAEGFPVVRSYPRKDVTQYLVQVQRPRHCSCRHTIEPVTEEEA